MSSGSNDVDDDSGDRGNREVTRQFLTKRDKHATPHSCRGNLARVRNLFRVAHHAAID